jgi:hypothetical protein
MCIFLRENQILELLSRKSSFIKAPADSYLDYLLKKGVREVAAQSRRKGKCS